MRVRPQARLSQAVGGDGVGLPEPGAGEDDGPRQAVEQGDVVRRQGQLPQLVLAAGPGGGERPVDGLEVAELLGEGEGRLPGVGRPGDERDAHRRPRLEADPPPQAEDRVQHRAGRPRQARPAVQGRGIGRGPAAAQEPGPVGLVLERRSPGRPPPRRGRPRPASRPRPAAGGGPGGSRWPGSNSVSRNSFAKAGWAWSARRWFRHTSA